MYKHAYNALNNLQKSNSWKKLLIKANDLIICLVNGDYVRDNFDIEFALGGHHYRYKFIPENEIWVELVANHTDLSENVAHEIFEYLLMKLVGMSYDAAHSRASQFEKALRLIHEGIHQPEIIEKSEKEIELGIKVEQEHADTLKQIIADVKAGKQKPFKEYFKDIAEDHLDELENYYTKLIEMEKEAEKLEKSQPIFKIKPQAGITSQPDKQVYNMSDWSGKTKGGATYPAKRMSEGMTTERSKQIKQKLHNVDPKDESSMGMTKVGAKGTKPLAIQKVGSGERTAAHEGTHYLTQELVNKHGAAKTNKFYDHIIGQLHPKLNEHLDKAVDHHYAKLKDAKDPNSVLHKKVEKVNLIRDTISGGRKREHLKRSMGVDKKGSSPDQSKQDQFRNVDNMYKKAWKTVTEHAKNYDFKKPPKSEKLTKSEQELEQNLSHLIEIASVILKID